MKGFQITLSTLQRSKIDGIVHQQLGSLGSEGVLRVTQELKSSNKFQNIAPARCLGQCLQKPPPGVRGNPSSTAERRFCKGFYFIVSFIEG